MQASQLPTFTPAQSHADQKSESNSVPELWREDFGKSGQVTHHEGKSQHIFAVAEKISKLSVTEDCFIEFSEKVQQLHDFHGIASDLLCRAHKFSRKQKLHIPPKVSVQSTTQDLAYIINLAESRIRSREWANGRGDIEGTPQYFINQAKRISQQYGAKLTVIEGDELLEKGFRLLHAVGRGSKNAPAFINLSYNGNPNSDKWVAFVGKGVCFDTGGYNIKTVPSIKDMFLDKHGATNVLSAFETILKEKLEINITASVGMVENFVSDRAYRPADIIKSRKGLTVEIGNTDAEGRLVLCDCMHWTQQNYKVDCLLEQSTLTGAMIVSLGSSHAGVYVNNDDLYQSLSKAGKETHDLVWQMPLTDYNRDMIKIQKADITNFPGRTEAGSAQAAAFLERFVEEGVRWAHIDIAGVAIVGGEGTGVGARLLVQFARNYTKN